MGGNHGVRLSVCVLVLAASLWPAPARSQVGRTEVLAVHFEGNESFPDDSLARAIFTRQTECRGLAFQPLCWIGADFAERRFYLRERQLPNDSLRLIAFYERRGFREVSVGAVRTPRGPDGIEVSFLVDEGTPDIVRTIEVVGVEELGLPDISGDLPLRTGERLSLLTVEATRDSLDSWLSNQGYAHVEVFRRQAFPANDPHGAEVTFEVDPGPRATFGPIEISGNEIISDQTVRNTLRFREGDVFRRSRLLDGQARLFGLEIVRAASVQPIVGSATDSIIPVRIEIAEGDQYRVRYGGGLNNEECFDLEARWAAREFLGGGRTLQTRARISNLLTPQFGAVLCPQSGREEFADLNWLLAVDFTQPWIFSTRNSFVASLFGERQSYPDVFIREAVGLQAGLTRAIGPQTRLTLSYRPELSRLAAADILYCTGFLVCTPEDIDILDDAGLSAPIGLSFTRNQANNPLNPTRGYNVVIDLEHAAGWTGSDFRYDRAFLEASTYSGAAGGIVAMRVRGGWVGAGPFSEIVRDGTEIDIVRPEKRFYSGGANSVRGYAQSRLGPRVLQVVDPVRLLTSRSDANRPGAGCSPLELVELTCDAAPLGDDGFVPRPTGGTRVLEANMEVRFPLPGRFEAVTFVDAGQVWAATQAVDLSDVQLTPGAGLRYLSPIGPIRLDVAYRFQGGQRLSVVTRQIRPADPVTDSPDDWLSVNGEFIPWIRSDEIAVLEPLVLFGETEPLSFRRFQIHISIGQAF